jgi:hypothetical protein
VTPSVMASVSGTPTHSATAHGLRTSIQPGAIVFVASGNLLKDLAVLPLY